MDVADLPQRWNELYQEHLGVQPESPSDGFLQDAQWYVAEVGMFPFYTIGDAIAAQIWFRMRQDLPDIQQKFRHGDLREMRN